MRTLLDALAVLRSEGLKARYMPSDKPETVMVLYGEPSSYRSIATYPAMLFLSQSDGFWRVSPPAEGRPPFAESSHSTLDAACRRILELVS